MRIAAIDIGTNTVLLTVAEVAENGQIRPILELARLPRLGEGVDQTRALAPTAVARTEAALCEYAEVCKQEGVQRLGVVGTSALRDAGGAERFLERAAQILGQQVEVASGRREAELTYAGALLGLERVPVGRRLVFDVGGGSTEFIVGAEDDCLLGACSLDIGSVRLYERSGRVAAPSDDAFANLLSGLTQLVSTLDSSYFRDADSIVGVAGTVTSLYSVAHLGGAADPGVAHGGRILLSELREVVAHLRSLSWVERERYPCLSAGRADVILYGASIVLAVLSRWARERGENDPELLVSERGVRYGRLLELARG